MRLNEIERIMESEVGDCTLALTKVPTLVTTDFPSEMSRDSTSKVFNIGELVKASLNPVIHRP